MLKYNTLFPSEHCAQSTQSQRIYNTFVLCLFTFFHHFACDRTGRPASGRDRDVYFDVMNKYAL